VGADGIRVVLRWRGLLGAIALWERRLLMCKVVDGILQVRKKKRGDVIG